MKKYLILADGGSPHTLKWAKELKKYFNIYMISFNGISDEIKEMIDNNKLYDLRVNISVSGGNINVLKKILSVKKIIEKIDPCYINAHYITSYGSVAIAAAMLSNYKGKVILSAWGSDILVTPFKNKLYFLLTKFCLSKSDVITSDSSYMCEVIKKIKFANNIITFPFGVGVLPQIVEQEKNYDYFFSNRALEENYNIDLVINIFAGIYEKNKEAKLFIANKGSKDNKLKKLAEKLKVKDNIEFLGFLSEQKQQYYYRKCGYYISVPKSDSTSVSLLEAMSYGCIPIVSNIPANTEWIEDKINGLYYERSKIPEFLCNAFRINREIIRERAIWSNNIKKFVKIILGE